MNIYVRSQDNDLLKYLNDEAQRQIEKQCKILRLNVGDSIIQSEIQAIVIVKKGSLSRLTVLEKKIGSVYPGEIDYEAGLFTDLPLNYFLRAKTTSEIMVCPYFIIQNLSDAEIQARIQAAINDSLSLKLGRLTHDNHD